MPKARTKRALKKRVRVTASGKIKRARASRRHLMRKKNSRRRLHLKKAAYISSLDEKKVKTLLP